MSNNLKKELSPPTGGFTSRSGIGDKFSVAQSHFFKADFKKSQVSAVYLKMNNVVARREPYADALDAAHCASYAEWVDFVEGMSFDFSRLSAVREEIRSLRSSGSFDFWSSMFHKIESAVRSYDEFRLSALGAPSISEESGKRLFLLIPVLAGREPNFHVDASDGCFSVDLGAGGGRIMSVHVGHSGHVNFSYVGKNRKILKITGTAKFRDFGDFEEFERVLRML